MFLYVESGSHRPIAGFFNYEFLLRKLKCVISHLNKIVIMKKQNIHGIVNKTLTKSVPIPPTQNVTLCETPGVPKPAILDIGSALEHLSRLSISHMVFASIQLEGALRVSELLATKAADVDKLGRLKVKGLKGSADKIVSIKEHMPFLKVYLASNYLPWENWDRFQIYRMYQKVGIKLNIEGGVRQSVTHALRHLSTQMLEDKSSTMDAAKVLLGHTNSANTEIYVKQTSAVVLNKKRQTGKSTATKGNNSNHEK